MAIFSRVVFADIFKPDSDDTVKDINIAFRGQVIINQELSVCDQKPDQCRFPCTVETDKLTKLVTDTSTQQPPCHRFNEERAPVKNIISFLGIVRIHATARA